MIPPELVAGFMADVAKYPRKHWPTIAKVWTSTALLAMKLPFGASDEQRILGEFEALLQERNEG